MKMFIQTISVTILFLSFYNNCYGQKWIILSSEDFNKSINPHAYITSISKNTRTRDVEVNYFGFASESGIPFFANGTIKKDNSHKIPNHSIYCQVTELQWQKIQKLKEVWQDKQYFFGIIDCVSFVAEAAREINLEVPSINVFPANLIVFLIEKNKDRSLRGWNSMVDANLFVTIKANNKVEKVVSYSVSADNVTSSKDNNFKWYDWNSVPQSLKIAASQITCSPGNALIDNIRYYLKEGIEVKIAAIDLNSNGIAGIAFKIAGPCSESVLGCRFGIWEDGGTKTCELTLLKYGEPRPSENGIIDGKGEFDSLISNESIPDDKKRLLLKLFQYSKAKISSVTIPQQDISPTGGLTPEELGRLIFKAIKTNNQKLYNSCIHPHPSDDNREKIMLDLARIREEFEEQGITDWNLAAFSRVTFSLNPTFGERDGGVKNGEQVRRDFTIEFTYNNQEFLGRIEGATIVTFNKKYFVWNGGFSTSTQRM